VKGNVYAATKVFFETKVEGGLEALYAAIDDPALVTFIQQKFLPVAWYDVLPAVPLIRAEAKVIGLTTKRYLQLRSAYQAQRDLGGIYRTVLKLATIETIALKLPQLFTQVFDFGSADARLLRPGHVQAFVLDFPPPLYEWFATALEVYAQQVMRLAGAREAVTTSRRVETVDDVGEEKLASLQLDLYWKP
jgi:hypothetical protein